MNAVRGRNAKFRLEPPIDTKTGTGGRTRQWPNLPDFGGSVSPLSATEQDLWERDVEVAALRLNVMARAIPSQHRDKVVSRNRVILLNRREDLSEEEYDIIGVNRHRRRGRINQFEIILGKIT
jgi:hypothetical protein